MKLNGIWNYIEDSESVLDYNVVRTKISENVYSGQMNIPSNWQLEGLDSFNGSVWFVKEFECGELSADNSASLLQFDGVDYFCDVWLNDIYIGRHEGYFQSFRFITNGALKQDAANILVVRVNSPKEDTETVWPFNKQLIKGIFNHHDCRPGGWNPEFGQDKNTGGIWNDVHLFCNRKVQLQDFKVTSKLISDDKKARVLVNFNYENLTGSNIDEEIKATVSSPDDKKNEYAFHLSFIPGFHNSTVSFDIDYPALWNTWDMGEQNLYRLEIHSESSDKNEITFGIRDVCLDDKSNFYLNNKKLFLRGTNIIPEQFMSCLDKDRIKKIVRQIKDANINIVRVHAHVNRQELYDEFDREGILLWQDFPLQWTYDNSPEFLANAHSQIKDMVRTLYNHPSIAFWCCHNEPGEQIKMMDPFLREAVLNEDSTRIVRLASNYEEHPYDGWYWGSMEHFAAAPMGPLVTEFGAQAVPSVSSLRKFMSEEEIDNPEWEKWAYHGFQYEQTFKIAKIEKGNSTTEFIENSQTYQSEYLRTAIDFYRRKKNDGITGIFQFMFIDCWPSITWSVVDYFGEPKKGYYTLREVFNPFYISVKIRQKEYLKKSFLNIDVWIINDMYEKYPESTLSVKCDGCELGEIENLNIDENSVEYIFWEKLKFPFPKDIKSGKHSIEICLNDSAGKSVAQKNFEISISDK